MTDLLIVDDDNTLRKNTARILQKTGYSVDTAATGREALEKLETRDFDVILLDLMLPDTSGLTLLEQLNNRGHESLVLMITAFGGIDTAVEAIKKGAFHYVTKPIDYNNLKFLIKEGLEKKNLREENLRLKDDLHAQASFSGIIGKSKAMREVIDTVRMAARSDSNVLIVGETGTGKEIFTDAIHYNSKRKRHPYRKINCAALTETILESELFGHEKGAYTDAVSRQKGFFELADKGTILLDEIGCMSPRTQSKFLRVLEDKIVKRIGGEREFKVDVRIVASTNEDLGKAVEEKRFRRDLFYRLNVLKITLPPLRVRKDDIPLLVQHFVGKFSIAEKPVEVSTEVMELLLDYSWPGNVRELENIIERAFIFDLDGVLLPEHLPNDFGLDKLAGAHTVTDADLTLDEYTRLLIQKTVAKTDGNQSQAARILGVSRYFIARHLK